MWLTKPRPTFDHVHQLGGDGYIFPYLCAVTSQLLVAVLFVMPMADGGSTTRRCAPSIQTKACIIKKLEDNEKTV
ncbi:MAG: hypothetical protein LKE41_02680 [Prevotella sp.]|nr:hypothetical protein [Prevotella sp.]MCI2103239.1 hypothetical protein [Prevotella sp.]